MTEKRNPDRLVGALHHMGERCIMGTVHIHGQYYLFLILPVSSDFRIWLDTPCGVKQDDGGAQVRIPEPNHPGLKSGIAKTDDNSSERFSVLFLPLSGQGQTHLKQSELKVQCLNSTGTVYETYKTTTRNT